LTVPTLFSVQSATLYPRPPSNVCSVYKVPTNEPNSRRYRLAQTATVLRHFNHLSLLGVSICGTVPNSILQQSEAFHFDWIGLDWISESDIHFAFFLTSGIYIKAMPFCFVFKNAMLFFYSDHRLIH
jgi:hypothetical protein